MRTMKIAGSLAVAALAITALSGCVTIETAPRGAADAPPATSPAQEPSQAGDGADETEASGDEATDTDAEPIDLARGEEGTVYARAHQAFSPKLVVWLMNEADHSVTYTEYNCLGSASVEATGSYAEPGAGDTLTVVTWDDGSPLGGGTIEGVASTNRIVLSESELSPEGGIREVATTDAQGATDEFTSKCIDAGETAASFLF